MIVKLGSLISEYSVRNKADEDIPVYSVTNEQGFCTGYFSKEVASQDRTTYKIVPRGCFAYNPSRINVGSVDVQECEDRVIVSPLYVVFSVNEKLNRRYLLHYLKSDITLTYIKAYASGSVRDNLKFSILKDFPINLPSAEEQEQIVATLDGIEHLIALRKKELVSLDELVKSRFVELFGDAKLNPKGYPVKALSEIAEYWNGLTYKPEDVADSGTIVLRSSNIQNAQLDFEDIVRVNCKIGDKKFVQKNDILMCTRNGSARLVGKVALIQGLDEPMSFGAFMMIIRSQYYPYLLTFFQTSAFREQIATGATTTINQITGNMLNKVVLPVPDIETMNEFAAFCKQTDKSKLAVKQSLEKLETLKKSLMQQYFG